MVIRGTCLSGAIFHAKSFLILQENEKSSACPTAALFKNKKKKKIWPAEYKIFLARRKKKLQAYNINISETILHNILINPRMFIILFAKNEKSIY